MGVAVSVDILEIYQSRLRQARLLGLAMFFLGIAVGIGVSP